MTDIYEPQDLQDMVSQAVPTTRMDLNHALGIADYFWYAYDGHRIQVERKQVGEVLGGMDKVEELLGRELSNGVEETILLIEGVISPKPGLRLASQIYRRPKNGKDILLPAHPYNVNYQGLQSWKYQLHKSGVEVVETFDWQATAYTLVALYQNSQQPESEHSTLKRYIKDRIIIKSKNIHIYNLMALKGSSIGEERATALIERFGTFWYVIHEPAESIAETEVGGKRIGMATAIKLLRSLKGVGNE